MDSLSDSSRCELDSVTSSDSLHLFVDEFRLHHMSSPDVSNAELSKRLACLDLENERLRIDLESGKIETNARNASNQALKCKIAELFVEAQNSLQEKQKLQNSLKDANSRLASVENSSKWYKSKLHDSQANEKARQMEIDTYQAILRQRQQSLHDMTMRFKQFNVKSSELSSQWRKEKREFLNEIENLQSQKEICNFCREGAKRIIEKDSSSDLLECKLEMMEKSYEDCQAQLQMVEERLAKSEISRNSSETAISKYRWLMSSMEQNGQKLEAQKNEMSNKILEIEGEMEKLRDENEKLEISVLSSKREQVQVEEAIIHLRSQLEKMIAQYKLIKSRNSEAERKLNLMEELQNENKRLKSLSHSANNSLFKKLKEEKRRVKNLENQLRQEKPRTQNRDEHLRRDKMISSMRDCLRRALKRNEELKERLKTKISDESIDEGYGDGSISVSGSSDLPSPPNFDTVLIKSAIDVLSRSKNFMSPLETSLDQLSLRIKKNHDYQYSHFHNAMITQYYDTRQTSQASPQNNARSVA